MLTRFYQIFEESNLWESEKELKRNEFLTVKGNRDTNIYFIKSGALRIYVEDEYEEHTIRFGYQDNFITALDSYLKEIPTNFYIQALKKTEVLVAKKSEFEKVMSSNQELLTIWTALGNELIYQQLEREVDLLTFSPKDRYQRVLERSPKLFQEIPNKYIASYLRMTPETLSRFKR